MQDNSKQIAFTVWQFVRVMVQLEETANLRGCNPRDVLYKRWHGAWVEVDKELTNLGNSSASEFSDIMMNHDVMVSCENGVLLGQLLKVIEEVIWQLSEAIKTREGGSGNYPSLKFEQAEMGKLKKRIALLARQKQKNLKRTK